MIQGEYRLVHWKHKMETQHRSVWSSFPHAPPCPVLPLWAHLRDAGASTSVDTGSLFTYKIRIQPWLPESIATPRRYSTYGSIKRG